MNCVPLATDRVVYNLVALGGHPGQQVHLPNFCLIGGLAWSRTMVKRLTIVRSEPLSYKPIRGFLLGKLGNSIKVIKIVLNRIDLSNQS